MFVLLPNLWPRSIWPVFRPAAAAGDGSERRGGCEAGGTRSGPGTRRRQCGRRGAAAGAPPPRDPPPRDPGQVSPGRRRGDAPHGDPCPGDSPGDSGGTSPPRDPRAGECWGRRGAPSAQGPAQVSPVGRVGPQAGAPRGRGDRGVTRGGSSRWEGALGGGGAAQVGTGAERRGGASPAPTARLRHGHGHEWQRGTDSTGKGSPGRSPLPRPWDTSQPRRQSPPEDRE